MQKRVRYVNEAGFYRGKPGKSYSSWESKESGRRKEIHPVDINNIKFDIEFQPIEVHTRANMSIQWKNTKSFFFWRKEEKCLHLLKIRFPSSDCLQSVKVCCSAISQCSFHAMIYFLCLEIDLAGDGIRYTSSPSFLFILCRLIVLYSPFSDKFPVFVRKMILFQCKERKEKQI